MSSKKVFLNIPVQNNLQLIESAIMKQFIEKKDEDFPTKYICITPHENSTYASLCASRFDANFFINTNKNTNKNMYINIDVKNDEKEKIYITYCDIAYTAINIYNMYHCDVLISEGNDVVMNPDVITLQSIALTLGIPTCLWRNDARLPWNYTQEPMTLTIVQPSFSMHVESPNFSIQSYINEKKQNNIKKILEMSLSLNSYGSSKSLPVKSNNKIRVLYNIGNTLLNKYSLKNIINGENNQDQAIKQFEIIKNFFENSENELLFNNLDRQFLFPKL